MSWTVGQVYLENLNMSSFVRISLVAVSALIAFGFTFDFELPQAFAERAKVYRAKSKKSGSGRKGVKARGKRSGGGGSYGIAMSQSDFCSKDFNFVLNHPRATQNQGCNFKIASDFKNAVENDLKECLKQASEEMGWGAPTFMTIKHDGCYVPRGVRGGGGLSSHATARGLDINNVELQFMENEGLRTENISFQKGTKYPKYYTLVRECWGSKHPCNRSIGYAGARSVKNGIQKANHNDHLHISKTCPPKLSGHASY